MIFQSEHIRMIRNALIPEERRPPNMKIKTQTRRVKRGIYRVGGDYAIQPGRGKKGVLDIRIVIDEIRLENCSYHSYPRITYEDAEAEGGYHPGEFEELFERLNSKWNRKERWTFEFHVVQIPKEQL